MIEFGCSPVLDGGDLKFVGGDVTPESVLEAEKKGIFPWFNEGCEPQWYSPEKRMVLFPDKFRRIKHNFTVTYDECFRDIVEICGDRSETWLSQEMQSIFQRLHTMGISHSIEVWDGAMLVGGLFGERIGMTFCGESMFSRIPGASKAALQYLCDESNRLGLSIIDGQVESTHLKMMGFRTIPREEFLAYLETKP
jgi:leucyl/phenylalanyl-tRNA--protein transferase